MDGLFMSLTEESSIKQQRSRIMKKTWNTPELRVYGSIESLTQVRYKDFGGSDGLSLVITGESFWSSGI
jgi:hypothetical protein